MIEKNRVVWLYGIDDIISLMSSVAFRLVPNGGGVRSRFPLYKSGWYSRCCDLTGLPDEQYPYPCCKMFLQTGGADYGHHPRTAIVEKTGIIL